MTPQPSDKSNSYLTVDASPEFKKQLRVLQKRYRNIRKDIESVLRRVQSGELLGNQIAGTDFTVYKIRVKNSDIKKGKSAGYRIIYQVESEERVALIAIYSKSDKNSISTQLIKDTISGMKPPSD